jgi:hypothetical protein
VAADYDYYYWAPGILGVAPHTGVTHIGEGLSLNSSLTALDLNCTYFAQDGASSLASFLANNKTLLVRSSRPSAICPCVRSVLAIHHPSPSCV